MARKKVRVLLAGRTDRDLNEIYRYLAEHSSRALETVDQALFKAFRRLKSFPNSGHWVGEFSGKRYREVRVFHFRIIYRYQEDQRKVMILTIRHGRRFFPKLTSILD